MQCNQEELLFRFIDSDLDPQEAGDFDRHFSSCTQCRVEYHEIIEKERALRDIVQKSFPAGLLAEKVMLRIRNETPNLYPQKKPGSLWRWLIPVLVPALAVALFFLKPDVESKKSELPKTFVAAAPLPGVEETLPGWNKISNDFIGISSLGPNGWMNGNSLIEGRIMPVERQKVIEVKGSLAFAMDSMSRNKVTWDGSGIFSLTSDMITWNKGAGDFQFDLESPVTVQVGDVGFRITGTRIHIEGDVQSAVQVEVLSGKVFYNSKGKSGYLKLNSIVTVEGDRISQVLNTGAAPIHNLGAIKFSNPSLEGTTHGHLKDPDRETSGSLPDHK